MSVERQFSAWAVDDGYDEFVARATDNLTAVGSYVLGEITRDTVAESTWHPNGFLINKTQMEDGEWLRLHIWPTLRVDDLTPHSHNWHMASLVLAGTYLEYVPNVRLDNDSGFKLMGTVFDENGDQKDNQYTGRNVDFELGPLASYSAGDFHYLPGGEFHVTPLPEDQPIVTLVHTGRQLFKTPTYVLRQINQDLQLTNAEDRPAPTADQVDQIWSEVKPIIKASPLTS